MAKAKTTSGFGNCIPPTLQHLRIYFEQKGLPSLSAESFYSYCQQRNWKTKTGIPIKNWKAAANNWMWVRQQAARPQTIEIKLQSRFSGLHSI